MDDFSFTRYLNSISGKDKEIFSILWNELDLRLYDTGNNYKRSKERMIYGKDLKNSLYNLIYLSKILVNQKKINNLNPKIISNSHFHFNEELFKLGFDTYRPVWNPTIRGKNLATFSLYYKTMQLKNKFSYANFNELLSDHFIKQIYTYKEILKKFLIENNVQALFVPFESHPFENLSIKIFKEIKKPSFVFLHGLPGIYNKYHDNTSDYKIVWGNKIKENYVKYGFDKNKILVSGHPIYKNFTSNELRNNLSNILVLTKAAPIGQLQDRVRLGNRGNMINYLYWIKKILLELGVKSVRLRPHQSESGNWYMRFIDKKFFILDNERLTDSLKKSSLVIGPASTVLLESIYYGVNYVVFDPYIENYIGLHGHPVAPPFDGSDKRIPAAKNEEELLQLLKDKMCVDPDMFYDYIKVPFDIGFIRDYITD